MMKSHIVMYVTFSVFLTECDKCLKWFCHNCHGLTPDIFMYCRIIIILWLCKPYRVNSFITKLTTSESKSNSIHIQTIPHPLPKVVNTTNIELPYIPLTKPTPPSPVVKHPGRRLHPFKSLRGRYNSPRFPPRSNKIAWYKILSHPNTSLNNFRTGKHRVYPIPY